MKASTLSPVMYYFELQRASKAASASKSYELTKAVLYSVNLEIEKEVLRILFDDLGEKLANYPLNFLV